MAHNIKDNTWANRGTSAAMCCRACFDSAPYGGESHEDRDCVYQVCVVDNTEENTCNTCEAMCCHVCFDSVPCEGGRPAMSLHRHY